MRSLRNRPVVLAAVIAVLAAAGVVVALLRPWEGAGTTAERYAEAWAAGNAPVAGGYTTDPAAAGPYLERARTDLSATAMTARVTGTRTEGERATSTIEVNWDLGQGRAWNYTLDLPLVAAPETDANDTGWAVDWSPAAFAPDLADGQRPVARTVTADPAPVLDASGATLLAPTPVVTITLDKRNVAQAAGPLGSALGGVDPAITRQSITAGANGTPEGQAYTVAVLRQPDYQRVRDRIYELPGVRFAPSTRLLPPDSGFAGQVIQGARAEIDKAAGGTPGWSVDAVGADGSTARSLTGTPPGPGQPVTLELDRTVQDAAQAAVDGQSRQAMIVAVRPSTGAVLAVAQNPAADRDGAVALTGRYPPGSTFKMITAYGAMPAENLTPQSPVDCPGTTVIDGRTIPNEDTFALGTVPLQQAFARSCNTTFTRLALGLPAEGLPNAGKALGFGADWNIPGMTTITGSVDAATDDLQRASDGMGQGDVLASPFGMAMVSATIAHGAPVTPSLIRGLPSEATVAPGTPDRAVLDQLRPMMRAVVTSGTATAVNGQGEVFGKTGTAEYAGPDGSNRAHGWFTGYRGDLAFATLIVDGGSSGPAVQLSSQFLQNVPR
ncbi:MULTISPECIES: penicillin-binding transpeptidase domain-containing protein [unclassified Pseudonocardia]|uniref:penicillin-binding transpeptidase domain-containing protein n=1 Tax=unclassified Pseudonocardia TaxID=2619320 RepID=UPI0007621E3B|nr:MULTISPECIES: penicillin-binding transpeptidase domain-containing protein [unclassified Pseudonocardia]